MSQLFIAIQGLLFNGICLSIAVIFPLFAAASYLLFVYFYRISGKIGWK